TFGEFGVFSFNTNKVISTLGGGVLVCKRKKDFELASLFARQGKIEAPHYEHSVVGYNYSMSSIAGALGLAQIKKIIPAIRKRQALFEYYRDQLKECPNLKFLEVADDTFSNKWMFCVLTPSHTHRENLRLALLAQNIESRPLWKPMHQQTIFKDNLSYLNGVSDVLFQKGVCLPSSSSLSLDDINRITSVIKNLYVNV
ncbi:MAG: DegT/DnrJ/EryC1/StrS family aminotransferase, partial [Flavicella sp.]